MVRRSDNQFGQSEDVFDPQAVTEADIRGQLGRVLSSASFRQADRLRAFLSFAVQETLAGRTSSISAPTVAVEVFGNGRDLDQKSESLVRVQARQLRLKLNQYYDTEGMGDPVRIDVPPGGYVATFRRVKTGPNGHGLVYSAQAVRHIGIFVDEFEYLGDDTDRHDDLAVLRDAVVDGLGVFDYLAVSAQARFQPETDARAIHPTALRLTAGLSQRGGSWTLSVILRAAAHDRRLWSRKYPIVTTQNDWPDLTARHIIVNVAGYSGPAVRFALEQFEHMPELADGAFHAFLEGVRFLRAPTPEENARLIGKFETVLHDRPGNAAVNALLSRLECEGQIFFEGNTADPDVVERALQRVQMAVTTDPSSALAWRVLATIRHETRQFDRAYAAAERSMALNPNDTDTIALAGGSLWRTGRYEDGLSLVQQALDLNDDPPSWYYISIISEAIRTGQFDLALKNLVRMEIGPFFWVHFLEAVIFGHLGRADDFDRAYQFVKTKAPHSLVTLRDTPEAMLFPEEFLEQCRKGLSQGCRLIDAPDWRL